MKIFKNGFKILKYNFSSILLFEIIYKLITAVFFVPVLYTIINTSISLAGIKFLSLGNMVRYLTSPTTYLAIIVILLFVSIYFLINISGIIYAMEASHREIKTNALQLLVKGVVNALRLLKPKNLFVILDVLFVLPFIYSAVIFSSILELKFPDYFYQFINNNKRIFIMICIVYFLLCVLAMVRLLTINYYSLHKTNYKTSSELSKKIVKNNFIKIIGGVIIINILIASIMIILEGLVAGGLFFIMGKILTYKKLRFVFSSILNAVILIIYMICVIISTPIIYAYICACFYQIEGDPAYDSYKKYKEKKKKSRIGLDEVINDKKKRRLTTLGIVLICLSLNIFYIYLSSSNKISLNIAYANKAHVTAHRGDSIHAPENTISAFLIAAENQADSIELDVRQTKDGEYVVVHDESLKRTTGVDKKVGEVTLDYIKTLDAGSYFSEDFTGEKIPTLRETLDFAKEEDIFLNIELKPAITDKENYVQGIIDLLEEYEYLDNCVIASSNYNALKQVKEINEDIYTVFIMYMAYGEIGEMKYVDAFSIKHNFITMRLVRNVHKNGKEIYAWTVDSESRIKDLLLLDVDVIITNNPYNTKDVIYNANDSLISDWFRRLLKEY